LTENEFRRALEKFEGPVVGKPRGRREQIEMDATI